MQPSIGKPIVLTAQCTFCGKSIPVELALVDPTAPSGIYNAVCRVCFEKITDQS